jgi:ketosteroid isomerase-like protein
MTMIKICLGVALAACMPSAIAAQDTAATYQPLPSVDLPPELDRVLRDYETAWAAGDEDALAALFTEDGFVPTRFGWVRGQEGIHSVYESSSGPLRLRAIAFRIDGSVGYIVGAFNYRDPIDGIDGGKFLLALRRDTSGRWLIAADLDNGNRPQ